MARNRIIYQSESVLIDGATAEGVQSCSYGLDVTREDVLQFGDLGAVDRIILEAPVANMEVSMYVNGLSGNHLNDIVNYISKQRKKGRTKSELTNRFRGIDRARMKEFLETLIEGGEIVHAIEGEGVSKTSRFIGARWAST